MFSRKKSLHITSPISLRRGTHFKTVAGISAVLEIISSKRIQLLKRRNHCRIRTCRTFCVDDSENFESVYNFPNLIQIFANALTARYCCLLNVLIISAMAAVLEREDGMEGRMLDFKELEVEWRQRGCGGGFTMCP